MAPFQVAGRLLILGSEVIFEVRKAMRVVGKRKIPLPGQNGPSEADVLASQEIAERWAIDAMVERNLELADRSGETPKLR
jgi:hypothetical protein